MTNLACQVASVGEGHREQPLCAKLQPQTHPEREGKDQPIRTTLHMQVIQQTNKTENRMHHGERKQRERMKHMKRQTLCANKWECPTAVYILLKMVSKGDRYGTD